MTPLVSEFRDSLPEILEGRDPIVGRPVEFYRNRLERFNRVVHISEPVAKIVENARRANGAISVAVATGGAAQIIRHPRNVAPQPGKGEIDGCHSSNLTRSEG